MFILSNHITRYVIPWKDNTLSGVKKIMKSSLKKDERKTRFLKWGGQAMIDAINAADEVTEDSLENELEGSDELVEEVTVDTSISYSEESSTTISINLVYCGMSEELI